MKHEYVFPKLKSPYRTTYSVFISAKCVLCIIFEKTIINPRTCDYDEFSQVITSLAHDDMMTAT